MCWESFWWDQTHEIKIVKKQISDLEILWKIEVARIGLVTLCQTQNTISLTGESMLVWHQEKIEWVDTRLSCRQADHVLSLITLHLNERAKDFLFFFILCLFEPRWLFRVKAIASTTVTLFALYHKPVWTRIINDFNLFVALSNIQRALIKIVPVIDQNASVIITANTATCCSKLHLLLGILLLLLLILFELVNLSFQEL